MLRETDDISNALETKAIDFYEVFGPYLGKDLFLAVKDDHSRVIAFGDSPSMALEKSIENGYNNPIIMKAPKDEFWSYVL